MTESIGAIIVAAGRSRRMGGADKLWIPIGGLPLLGHTIAALGRVSELSQIVLVTSPESAHRLEPWSAQAPWNALTAIVEGGAERSDSVYAGLKVLVPCDLVVVHDGARPCVTPELVRAGLAAAREDGAAIAALPVTDTIKTVDEAGRVTGTPERARLRAVQTPQVFRYGLLRRAHEAQGQSPERSASTDDATLVERLGLPVATLPGDPRNVKVSTPADIPLIRLLLEQ